MKRIGLLGGMSWESSIEYYRIINQEVQKRLGGVHSGDILMHSFDFQEVYDLMHAGNWDGLAEYVGGAAGKLKDAGAECMLICTNTVHNVAPQVEAMLDIPLIHIADAAGQALAKDGVKKVGLLGTKFTMELDFYSGRLAQNFGIETIIPNEEQRCEINRTIFDEMVKGHFLAAARAYYLDVIDELAAQGAEAIVLGCTEIPILVTPEHTNVPLIDTTQLHAMAAVEFALS